MKEVNATTLASASVVAPRNLSSKGWKNMNNEECERIHKKGMRIGYVLGLVFAAFAAYITHVMG